MACAAYLDPRLAAVYDPLNRPSEEGAFYAYYLRLAGDQPLKILDMGCGTGRLAVQLAERGHAVTGAEPADAMLDIARKRQGGDSVTWVASDAAGLSLGARFDLIIMTGHAFQTLLDDEEVGSALAAFRRHLAPSGLLAFETRNPLVREWEDWVPEKTREIVDVPKLGLVSVHNDIASVSGEYVTFETHFRFAADDIVVASHTLRFMGQARLARFLDDAGFANVTWYGNWDRSPAGSASPELIVVAG